jgi:hypothetical protein
MAPGPRVLEWHRGWNYCSPGISTTALTMGNKATTLSNGTEAGNEGIDKFELVADKFRGTKAV